MLTEIGNCTIVNGDALETLRLLPERSIQTCITSPPYWGLRDYGLPKTVWDGDPACEHEWVTETVATEIGKGNWSQGTNGRGELQPGGVNAKREPIRATAVRGFCSKCNAWLGSHGLEPTPELYTRHSVQIFREVRRVLRDDGTLWLNLGDSYAGSGKGGNPTDSPHQKQRTNAGSLSVIGNTTRDAAKTKFAGEERTPPGLKPKDLVGIPWRVAFALQADGWYLRQDIIWAKPNPMPESVRDRCTKSHEYIFLLTKSEKYYFDHEAIKEPMAAASLVRLAQDVENQEGSYRVPGKTNGSMKAVGKGNAKTFRGGGAYTKGQSFDNSITVERESHGNTPNESGTRNKRSVWTVTTKPFKGAHFATFPPDLIEPCILAGTSEKGRCPNCGAPWKRVVEKGAPDLEHQIACGGDANGEYDGVATKDYAAAGAQDASATKARILAGMVAKVTTGWVPTCTCRRPVDDATDPQGAMAEALDENYYPPTPCIVLDPFAGAGTTGLVAQKLGRASLLIELNPAYVGLIETRLKGA